MTQFILRAVIAALGLWLATEWVDGITIDSPATLLLAGLLLGIVNAFVRPGEHIAVGASTGEETVAPVEASAVT